MREEDDLTRYAMEKMRYFERLVQAETEHRLQQASKHSREKFDWKMNHEEGFLYDKVGST
jgi:hypothetical protein